MKIHITVPYDILVQRLDDVIRLGLNPEIYLSSSSLDQCTDADVSRLGKVLRDSGLSYTFHAPYMDLAPGGVDKKIRQATRERLEQVIHLASLIHPEVIVFHPEYDRWRHGEVFDLWLQGSLEMWSPLVKEAEAIGVRVALENVFEDGPHILAALLEKIDSPNCGFCLDTGHCQLFSSGDWEHWLVRLAPRLFEVHLHDNDGSNDQHLPPGEGRFDFVGLFAHLKGRELAPVWTIEVHREEEIPRALETVRGYLATDRV